MFSDIIFLTGMPRSGTSWMAQIFDSCPDVRYRLSPVFSYEFKNYVTLASTRADWDHVFQGAYRSESEFMSGRKRREAGLYPVFSHKAAEPRWLVVKDTRFHDLTERMLQLHENMKIVGIVRHPCGAIHSWLTTPREFPAGADAMHEWRTGACRKNGVGEFWGFDDWLHTTRMLLDLEQRWPKHLRVQHYEAVVRTPAETTRELFDFCGLPYTQQTDDFVRQSHMSHMADAYAVFKDPSVADRWRTQLQPDIQAAILEETARAGLERFLN
jgi:hypothetical protein